MTVAGRSLPGEATERKSQRQGPGCIKPCFEIIVTSSLNLKLFFATRQRFPAKNYIIHKEQLVKVDSVFM